MPPSTPQPGGFRRRRETRSKPLRPGARWLLARLVERYEIGLANYGRPLGLSLVTFSTFGAPELVTGHALQGLVRRGWAVRDRTGLYYATEKGVTVHRQLPSEPQP